jgi:N-acetylneuraminic acid mutarotase
MAPKKEKSSTKQSKAVEKQMRKEEKKKKQELKSEKSQKKKEAKELDGEEDIQTTVSKLEKAKKSSTATPPSVTVCAQPGPRSAFSVVQSPLSDEIIMFGGQYYDGSTQFVYGETYRWSISKNEWRMVEVSPSPNPRSCHQAVVHKHHMYIFGGEFSTLRQFYHFRDLWRFDMKANTWEEVRGSGQPPTQRSGHRMIVWKGFIVVFGGFHDTFRDCKYYNDLHVFNIAEERWHRIDVSEISIPSPRSGCGFFLHPTNDLAFVYGGYVRDKKVSGTDLNDMWQLSLRLLPGMAVPVKVTWERLSRRGTPPTRRSGASFTVHKNRALVFGGVFDKDTEGLTMDSEFFNELYAFDMDRKRWYILDYNAPKSMGGKSRRPKKIKSANVTDEPDMSDDQGDEDTTSLGQFQWVFEYVDEHGEAKQMVVDDQPEEEIVTEPLVESSTPVSQPAPQVDVAASTPVASVPITTPTAAFTMELPPERMGASMFVSGNSLVVFGGISEVQDTEVTYDDCWTLDLNARDRWVKKLDGTMHLQEWLGEEEESDDEEFGSEFDDDSDYSDSDESGSGSSEDEVVEEPVVPVVKSSSRGKSLKEKMEKIRSQYDLTESYTPLVGETLKDFFARTQAHWTTVVSTQEQPTEVAEYERIDLTDKKDIRKRAFVIAGDRFGETASILAKLADYESQQAAVEAKAAEGKKKKK